MLRKRGGKEPRGLRLQRKIGLVEMIVKTLFLRLGQHVLGNIETFQPVCEGADFNAKETGAAANIDNGVEDAAFRCLADQFRQLLRHTVIQLFDKRGFETVRIIVEEPFHIAAWRLLGRFGGAENREFQLGCKKSFGVQLGDFPVSRDGFVRFARFFVIFPEAKPARRPPRRKLQRLFHEFGGGGKVTALRQHAGIVRPAVGNDVTGRKLVWGHSRFLRRCRLSFIKP